VFLADTDRENIQKLGGLLEREQGIVPDIWRDSRGYRSFVENPERKIVFIRIENPVIPGLELTRAAALEGNLHIVWMAESDVYALDAFYYGAEAYLLLPAAGERLRDIIDSLGVYKRGIKHTGGEGKK
jgi:two-component SAPR family response regulator